MQFPCSEHQVGPVLLVEVVRRIVSADGQIAVRFRSNLRRRRVLDPTERIAKYRNLRFRVVHFFVLLS